MTVSYWCKKCNKDLDLESEKVSLLGDEYFRARCSKRHRVVRFITNKSADPYYHESRKMKRQKDIHKKDLIQPGEEGFQTLYKKEYDKLEKAREEQEKKELLKKKERDAFLEKYGYKGSGYRDIIKKVIETEEKL